MTRPPTTWVLLAREILRAKVDGKPLREIIGVRKPLIPVLDAAETLAEILLEESEADNDRRILQEIRRATPPGQFHDELARELDQISPASVKMIQDEAWEFFCAEAGVGTDKRKAFTAAIEHAFEHALEEGIFVPEYKLTQLAIYAANFEATAKKLNVNEVASALAIADGWNPNDPNIDAESRPKWWDTVKVNYQRQAEKIIQALK